jgi:hypothetical protein
MGHWEQDGGAEHGPAVLIDLTESDQRGPADTGGEGAHWRQAEAFCEGAGGGRSGVGQGHRLPSLVVALNEMQNLRAKESCPGHDHAGRRSPRR